MTAKPARILLSILDGTAAKCPDEMPGEQDTPCYYVTPKAAKEAGRAILERHPSARGIWVRRVFNVGQYRTVCVEAR